MPNNHHQSTDGLSAPDSDEQHTAARRLAAGTADHLPPAEEFDIDRLFDILSQPGRRYVLTYLLKSDGFVTCSELVDHVADVTDHTMTDSEFRTRVAAELIHADLPKLDEEGYVEYNVHRQLVAPTELTEVVRPYLHLALAQQKIASRRDD